MQIDVSMTYEMSEATDLLFQIEAATLDDQIIEAAALNLHGQTAERRVPGEAGIGERFWVRTNGQFRCDYRATARVDRIVHEISRLPADPLPSLPPEAVRCLMPSRYCAPDLFANVSEKAFTDLTGGAKIAAIRDWIQSALAYTAGVTDAETTAADVFLRRAGVCRDYAHLLIALARAADIPARYVACYAPDLDPPDFHAVAEVWLDGAWHLVDPTGMAAPDEIIRIGVGIDAAEVAFLTVFGQARFVAQTVSVGRADP